LTALQLGQSLFASQYWQWAVESACVEFLVEFHLFS
jgi:hypothetical protein